MNSSSLQHADNEDKVLESQGLASITLKLRWSDGRAEHEDEMHVDHFSVWREADLLPHEISSRIVGMRPGGSARAALSAGELTGCWKAGRQLDGSPSGFDRAYRRGLDVEPRYGRFYPQGFFNGFSEIVREAVEPARITALDEDSMRVDLNHPFARFSCDVALQLDQVLTGADRRGGRCASTLDDLVRYPGLAAPVQGGMDTDYGDSLRGMSRMDERDDAIFYSNPRMLQHLDSRALTTVNEFYLRVLPKDAEVLDLMASYDSHLQGCSLRSLHVLGMNANELQSNHAATAQIVQDLNLQPELPCGDASLDAVVCTASVEYLVKPQKVFLEVLRALRPGGIFALTFSNRWFPTKAIQIWNELQEFERVGLITQWLQHAGFDDLRTFSSRGWPRPTDDPHSRETPISDPVYAVWGSKPAT